MLFSVSVLAQRAPEPVPNMVDVAIVTSSKLTTEQVRTAIVSAAKSLGWVVAPESTPGSFLVSKSWGRHSITTEVKYTDNSYSLLYKDSINMKYGPLNGVVSIHPYYHRDVSALANAIRIQASKL
jgi:hypothetical protein